MVGHKTELVFLSPLLLLQSPTDKRPSVSRIIDHQRSADPILLFYIRDLILISRVKQVSQGFNTS